MARKKKSKGSKFARMNDEERARYMQHRAEIELETKRRKQQLIATFTKIKLAHEEAFSKLNAAKINEKWRYALRRIKCKELHERVTYLCTNFERVTEAKDAMISYLYGELKAADKDHRKLQENHIALINRTIGKYKEKLEDLHDMYDFHNIKVNSVIELNKLRGDMDHDRKQISNILVRKRAAFDEEYSKKKAQNAVNLFSILYTEENRASELVHHSFLNVESIWDQLHRVINEYEKKIETKKKQHDCLKERDDVFRMSTLQYSRDSLQLQTDIENLRHDIEILSWRRKERIARLHRNDAHLKEKLKRIKHEFVENQTVDSLQLKQLTGKSNMVLKHLQTIGEKGSTILELLRTCSSLEPLVFNMRKYFIQDTGCAESAERNIPESCKKVNNFWEHYNHMKADDILLKRERIKLCTENRKLQEEIQIYLTSDLGTLALYPVTSSST